MVNNHSYDICNRRFKDSITYNLLNTHVLKGEEILHLTGVNKSYDRKCRWSKNRWRRERTTALRRRVSGDLDAFFAFVCCPPFLPPLSLSLRLITQAEKAASMPPARWVKKDMGTKRVKDQTRGGNGLVRGQMLIDSTRTIGGRRLI